MLTLELISRKRKPIKRNAFYGILGALLTLILMVIAKDLLSHPVKIALMIAVAITFIVCLYILNYSVGFKNVIGNISFYDDRIEIELLQKKEVISRDQIRNIRLRLSGYEGFNDSTIVENVIWFPTFFWYHSGLNNFIHIYTNDGVRIFEVFIPNRKIFREVKRMTIRGK